MSRKQQFVKNIDLSAKLTNYLLGHPEALADRPEKVSYVVFSATDQQLNKLNEKLLKKLVKKEGDKPIVKAEQQKNRKQPWKFTTISP